MKPKNVCCFLTVFPQETFKFFLLFNSKKEKKKLLKLVEPVKKLQEKIIIFVE